MRNINCVNAQNMVNFRGDLYRGLGEDFGHLHNDELFNFLLCNTEKITKFIIDWLQNR